MTPDIHHRQGATMRTRPIHAAAGLLAAAVLLTGCSGSSGQAEAKPKPSKTASPKEKFLRAVHDADFASWADKAPTDEELLGFPKQWCDGLAAGHSVNYLFSLRGENLYPAGMDWGTEKSDADELLVLGVTAYCPEYRDQVTQELKDAGEY